MISREYYGLDLGVKGPPSVRICHSSLYYNFPSPRYIKAGLHEHAEDKPLYEILHACQRGKSHLCIVNNAQGVTTGIITLEDVIEEILQVCDQLLGTIHICLFQNNIDHKFLSDSQCRQIDDSVNIFRNLFIGTHQHKIEPTTTV